jgi:hypothetical protein
MTTPTNHFLLLGAGFSRNWGGWLACEADEYLLGHALVEGQIRELLWRHRTTGGFEAALSALQGSGTGMSPVLANFQAALTDMFRHMDEAFASIGTLNFSTHRELQVTEFLARFDAIFTLNQDLLMERHYFPCVETACQGRWNGLHLPGIKSDEEGSTDRDWVLRRCAPRPSSEFTLHKKMQPYLKLHGSWNWADPETGQLLVLGGNKPELIARRPLLDFYHGEFESHLSRPDSKLLVIGYSFRDEHINRAIAAAVESAGLKLFIIDPAGSTVTDKNWDSRAAGVYKADDFAERLWPNLIGASRRSLREIFGTDPVEFEKINRFFSK